MYILPTAGVRFRKLLHDPEPPSGLRRSALRASCSRGLSRPSLLREEYSSLEALRVEVRPGLYREVGVGGGFWLLVRGLLLQVGAEVLKGELREGLDVPSSSWKLLRRLGEVITWRTVDTQQTKSSFHDL